MSAFGTKRTRQHFRLFVRFRGRSGRTVLARSERRRPNDPSQTRTPARNRKGLEPSPPAYALGASLNFFSYSAIIDFCCSGDAFLILSAAALCAASPLLIFSITCVLALFPIS